MADLDQGDTPLSFCVLLGPSLFFRMSSAIYRSCPLSFILINSYFKNDVWSKGGGKKNLCRCHSSTCRKSCWAPLLLFIYFVCRKNLSTANNKKKSVWPDIFQKNFKLKILWLEISISLFSVVTFGVKLIETTNKFLFFFWEEGWGLNVNRKGHVPAIWRLFCVCRHGGRTIRWV